MAGCCIRCTDAPLNLARLVPLSTKARPWRRSLPKPRLHAPPPCLPTALVPHRPAFFVDQALPFLLPLCTDPVLEARHGAVAAVAELLPALR